MFRPDTEGIDHINMYSKSTLEYGRMLSNFYKFPIATQDGNFMSVEGYWWWLSIEDCEEKEKLRNMYGYPAAKFGNELLGTYKREFVDDFEHRIAKAIWYKMRRHKNLLLPEYENLPIVHYYVYGSKILDQTQKFSNMMNTVNKLRDSLVEDPTLWR